MRKLLLLPIRFYQYAISPMMASHCRYHPSCSQYAVEAISHHGGLKGFFSFDKTASEVSSLVRRRV